MRWPLVKHANVFQAKKINNQIGDLFYYQTGQVPGAGKVQLLDWRRLSILVRKTENSKSFTVG